jgi:hypothetical protein
MQTACIADEGRIGRLAVYVEALLPASRPCEVQIKLHSKTRLNPTNTQGLRPVFFTRNDKYLRRVPKKEKKKLDF